MKYLFIIQGEGRGHLTQAMTMEKLLHSRGHEVVEMLVGKSESRTLPAFFTEGVNAPITYFESVNFVSAAQDKRPDALKTVLFNLAMSPKFIPSISSGEVSNLTNSKSFSPFSCAFITSSAVK